MASVWALLAANVLPLIGVLFFGWSMGAIMLIFWLENAVVGIYNIFRMLLAEKGSQVEKLFIVPFFTVHYGLFTLGHGVFVMAMFVHGQPLTGSSDPDAAATGAFFEEGFDGSIETVVADAFTAVAAGGLWWAVAALFISHGISFASNYLAKGEFHRVSADELMFRPYARVVVLHLVIIVGGMLIMATGEPVFALLLLVVLKIAIDLAAHLHEHAGLTERGVARAAARRSRR